MDVAAHEVLLPVSGMTCAACSARVEKVLGRLDGVQTAAVNLATERARITFDPDRADVAAIARAIERAGYGVPPRTHRLDIRGMRYAACAERVQAALVAVRGVVGAQVNPASERATVAAGHEVDPGALIAAVRAAGYEAAIAPTDAEALAAEEAVRVARERRELALLLGAGLLTLPLVAPMLAMPFGAHWMLPGAAQLALAAPVQLVAGWRFYRGALAAIRSGAANMDVLVALGTTAAFALSVALWWRGEPHLYFEAAAAVIALVRLGKWLEGRARRSAAAAVRALLSLRPATARVRRGEAWVELASDAVAAGDRVLVRPGERIPVDGTVVAGRSTVDESLLTGESRPVARGPGEAVVAGAVNGEGALELDATAVGADSALARIAAMVEAAQSTKAPVQRLADRVSAVFVPVVLALSALTLVGWGLAGVGWDIAVIRAVAVLVVACPCALGLATPAALVVGTGAGARAGILFRDAEALERARDVDVVVFDKTGTLTEGRPGIVEVRAADGDVDRLLARVAPVQEPSEHPLAAAFRSEARRRELPRAAVDGFEALAGRGVRGRLAVSGEAIAAGSAAWMAELGCPPPTDPEVTAHEARGHTVVWIAVDGALAGWVALGDRLRDGAVDAVRMLRARGVRVVMLTGDRRGTAAAVGRAVGVDEVVAEVLPADKVAVIERLGAAGRVVAMVGDGVNDAPALARADVGLAVGGGTDVAVHSAGVTLMRADPRAVVDALDLSRATSRTIRQNLFWAFVYNTVGLPFAALGLLGPVLAGGAMALSSVSVVTNALRLRGWRPIPLE